MEKPDKNCTGTSNAIPVDEMFKLSDQLTPGCQTYGLIYCTSEVNAVTTINNAKAYMDANGLKYVEAVVTNSGEVQQAAQSLVGRVDAIFVPNDSVVQTALNVVAEVAKDAKIPVYGSSAVMAMRAVSKDFETSRLMGIKINSVISVTFVIGSLLAAVGSILYFTNYSTVIQTSGSMPGLKAFVAAVFGGIGSVPGAVVGAFIIGICENLIKGMDTILVKAGISTKMFGFTTFSDAFTFALLIIILIVKPTGLFGEKQTDKV